jgi:hypothetical protein
MKRGFFSVRFLDGFRNSIEYPLVGDHPRHLLIPVNLGVEFDTPFAHAHLAARVPSMNANAVRWLTVPSAVN